METLKEVLETKLRIEYVEIGKDADNSLGQKLDTNYYIGRKILSIFGPVANIGNVLLYLSYKNFTADLLPKLHSPKFIQRIKKGGKKNVKIPNYWLLIELVSADRLFADKELLDEFLKFSSHAEWEEMYRLKPVKLVQAGVIQQKTLAKKLTGYTKGLHNVIGNILEYAEENNMELFSELDKDTFHNHKIMIKERIWNDLIKRKEENTNLLTGVADTPDEEVEKRFFR